MKIFTKYLLKELLMYYAICFLFFFMIFFVNQILLMVQDVLRQHFPLGDVLRLMLYCLPFVIAQAAPFATLVGFLMCVGRLVSDNELLMLNALGFGYKALFLPTLFVGIFIAFASFFVNDVLYTRGAKKYNQLYIEMLLSNPSIALEANSIKRTKNSTLVIGDVKENDVSDLLYFDYDSYGNQRIIGSRKTTIRQSAHSSVLMQLEMSNAMIFMPQRHDARDLDYIKTKSSFLNIFADSFFSSNQNGALNPFEMTTKELRNYVTTLEKTKQYDDSYINIFRVEYHRKYAVPFGSIFFALLAFSLGMHFGKYNGQTVGFIAGLVISVLYWVVQSVGQVFGQRLSINAFVVMWLPNALILFFSIILYAKKRLL